MRRLGQTLFPVYIALQLSLILSACPQPSPGSGLGQVTSCNSTGAKDYACGGNANSSSSSSSGGTLVPSTISGSAESSTEIEISWTTIPGTNVFLVVQDGTTTPTTCDAGSEITNASPYLVTGLTAASTYTFAVCQSLNGIYEVDTNALTLTTIGNNSQSPNFQAVVSSGDSSDSFGQAVAVSGNLALVGNPLATDGPYLLGSVYAYQLIDGTWTQTQVLTDPGCVVGEETIDQFGFSIAMLGTQAVIGTPYCTNMAPPNYTPGAAFYYEYIDSSWQPEAMLQDVSPDETGNSDYWFGNSVAIENGRIAVGSYQYNTTDGMGGVVISGLGAEYIFEGADSSWTQTKKVLPSDAASYYHFGTTTALQNGELFVGATGSTYSDNVSETGAVYIYEQASDWGGEQKIGVEDISISEFGQSLSASGTTLAIGDPNYNSSDGRVFIFSKSGGSWSLAQTIIAPEGEGSADVFGASLSLDGSLLAIGSPSQTVDSNSGAGAVILYQLSGSSYVQAPLPFMPPQNINGYSGLAPGLQVGEAVSVSGDTIVGGGGYPGVRPGVAIFMDDSYGYDIP